MPFEVIILRNATDGMQIFPKNNVGSKRAVYFIEIRRHFFRNWLAAISVNSWQIVLKVMISCFLKVRILSC